MELFQGAELFHLPTACLAQTSLLKPGGGATGVVASRYVDLAQRKNKLVSALSCVIISYKRGFSVRRLFRRVSG